MVVAICCAPLVIPNLHAPFRSHPIWRAWNSGGNSLRYRVYSQTISLQSRCWARRCRNITIAAVCEVYITVELISFGKFISYRQDTNAKFPSFLQWTTDALKKSDQLFSVRSVIFSVRIECSSQLVDRCLASNVWTREIWLCESGCPAHRIITGNCWYSERE